MKLGISIVGNIARIVEAETRAGEKAVSAAMREAGTSLKVAWRAQIAGAGLGTRLARTIRSIDQFCTACCRAAAPMRCAAPGFVSTSSTRFVSIFTSPGSTKNPVCPSSTVSGIEPTAVATTGRRRAPRTAERQGLRQDDAPSRGYSTTPRGDSRRRR